MPREESWKNIKGFPGYQVSDCGRVFGERTQTILSPSENLTGTIKVNLMRKGHTQTRSVRILVAEAFVKGKKDFTNPTPINMDGDQWNNFAENLTWRPRWFAWKYARQFHEETPPEYGVPVFDVIQRREHENVMMAGIADGVLWEYIYQSILTGRPVFPTGSKYIFAH